jgi:hypothetical protein
MAKAEDKKLAVQEPRAVVAALDYGDDAGAGFEGQTKDDLVMPFINVLQPLSKQVTGAVGEGGVEGARAGMLYNTVTQELFDGKNGLQFVPAFTVHQFVEWVPRKQGGGFVGIHELDSEVIAEAKAKSKRYGRYSTAYDHEGNGVGNDLVETYYVYGAAISEDGQPQPAVLAFTSTKIKAYRAWNTKLQLFSNGKIPLFAFLTRVVGAKQKNKEGEYFVFELAPANGAIAESLLSPTDPRFTAAKNVREMIKSGVARADYERQEAAGGAEAERGDPEKAPF